MSEDEWAEEKQRLIEEAVRIFSPNVDFCIQSLGAGCVITMDDSCD